MSRTAVFPWTALNTLQATLRGELLTPESPGYDRARTVWNGMIDARPALIVTCVGAADAIAAVQFARAHGARVSIRGGGHNVAGLALCDGGVTVDLSRMKSIRVNPTTRRIRAEGGVTWGELDREALAFGLGTTGGMISTTGIAGLTLGGGLGWQMARHGLACDNLVSADVVLADGRLVVANDHEHPDLFWGLRGGGGNFGIVTSFEYQLHPISTLVGGMILYPMSQARDVLRAYREYARQSPDDLTVNAALMRTPDGDDVVAILVAWFGHPAEAEPHVAAIRRFGTPIVDLVDEMSYIQLQTLLDAAAPAGLRRYWKSGYFPDLPDELIDTAIRHAAGMTSSRTLVMLLHMHGKASTAAPDATAFGARRAQWDFDIVPQWDDAAEDQRHIGWAKAFWTDVARYANGVYANHLDADDGAPRVRAAYGANFDRLVAVKRLYDPDNFFSVNHNIPPSAEHMVPRVIGPSGVGSADAGVG